MFQLGEKLTLRGIDFIIDVPYNCTFGDFWVDATFVNETALGCGALTSEMFPESQMAYTCQTVGVRDGLGFTFSPEIGTPDEY